ncbi:unnamed protein product, partial [Choristocarpus tenellus]
RASENPEAAEEQPDRVVFVEDIRPLLFKICHKGSFRTLVGMLLSAGGLLFPRSVCSHSYRALSTTAHATVFGDGGISADLLTGLNGSLLSAWKASGLSLNISKRGLLWDLESQGSIADLLVITSAADQSLLMKNEVVNDSSRQVFLRNVLHYLIRAPTLTSPPGSHLDMKVQVQCVLMMMEGWLSTAAAAQTPPMPISSTLLLTTAGNAGGTDGGQLHVERAETIAKSLLEASHASATDLRLWSAYVQLRALLGRHGEALKVAEKALSMTQVLIR